MATKLVTTVTYKLVTTDANGKETRQQMKKMEYEYANFTPSGFTVLLAQAAGTLNHAPV